MALWLEPQRSEAGREDRDKRGVADVIVQRLQALAAADSGQSAWREARGVQHPLACKDFEAVSLVDGHVHQGRRVALPAERILTSLMSPCVCLQGVKEGAIPTAPTVTQVLQGCTSASAAISMGTLLCWR